MGKKKSKTSKQKQAKTARKLSKVFAKKLGVSEGKPEAMVVDSKKKHNNSKRLMKKPRRARKEKLTAGVPSKTKGPVNPEQKEFDRQQASMFERERMVEWKRNSGPKKSNTGAVIPTSAVQLQPATFLATDADKSTAQLLHETVQKVSGLEGIGSSFSSSGMVTSMQPGQSSLAAAVAASGGSRWTDTAAPEQQPAVQNNPWAVLDTGDDDNENGQHAHHNHRQQPAPPSFQFAPPSFSFGNTTTPASTAQDFDPDL